MPLILAIIAAIAMVGLPAALGAFWLSRDIGRRDATAAVLLVMYAIMIGGLVIYMGPNGHLPGIREFAQPMPYVLAGGLAVGIFRGVRARRGGD
jgi:hypothetical protein